MILGFLLRVLRAAHRPMIGAGMLGCWVTPWRSVDRLMLGFALVSLTTFARFRRKKRSSLNPTYKKKRGGLRQLA
jgi:hypothetical protein